MSNDATAIMNSFLAGAVASKRGRLIGLLGGGPTLDTGDAMRERLAGALNDLEAAERRGDEDDVAYCEHRLDRVVEEAREARAAREQVGESEQGAGEQGGGFDGGVQRRVFPGRRMTQPTSTQLFAQALSARHAERVAAGTRGAVEHMNIR